MNRIFLIGIGIVILIILLCLFLTIVGIVSVVDLLPCAFIGGCKTDKKKIAKT